MASGGGLLFDLDQTLQSNAFATRMHYLSLALFAPPTLPPSALTSSGAGTSTALALVASSSAGQPRSRDEATQGAVDGETLQQPGRSQPGHPAEPASSRSLIVAADPNELRAKAERERTGAQELSDKPKWKIDRICVGHSGRVTSIAFDPSNEWFASGSGDATIRAWDLVDGQCRATLTGHKAAVEAIAVSKRSPYLFSAGQDRTIKCWDLEKNVVVRDYHGHLSAVHAVAAHPSQDLIVSGGRDATVRLWDVRSPSGAVHVMQGHSDTVLSVAAQDTMPQLISGGADGMIYLWDIISGRPITRLTRHKKPVRSLFLHPTQSVLVSVGADNARKWRLPTGEFIDNLLPDSDINVGHRWSCAAISPRDVLFIGAEGSGDVRFLDWSTGLTIKAGKTKSVKGTIEGEGGVLAAAFDQSGQRLITGEGDKTVKFWSPTAAA